MAQTIAEEKTENKAYSKQNKRIWMVFWILAIITAVEVVLGITHPDFLVKIDLWRMSLLNWIFVLLTVVKAYYIT